jgi:2-methylisocitrate lyase-like PEP mutase family enzyme
MKSYVDWNVKRLNLRQMVARRDDRILLAIGVSNGIEARQLHHCIYDLYEQNAVPDYIGGFITFVSGYLCAANYGLPDMGYILRHEIVEHTNIIEQATWLAALDTGKPALPIGVDIDTGYGNEPSSIVLTCRQVHKMGGQYVQIEDQYAINKTCGHMDGACGSGKLTISAEEMIELRLRPAVDFARCQDDLMVMARTDAVAADGFAEGLRRGQLYAEHGAELIFIEALLDDRQLADAAAAFKGSEALLVANMIEGSPKTPYKSPRELHEMGFDIGLYCVGLGLTTRAAQQRYFNILGKGESVTGGIELDANRWFEGFNKIIGRQQTERFNGIFRS